MATVWRSRQKSCTISSPKEGALHSAYIMLTLNRPGLMQKARKHRHLNNEAEAKARLRKIRKHLIDNAELATEHHLVDLFAVDNKSRESGLVSDPEVKNLRKKIQDLAKEFCFLGNVPIKWLQLELHLRKLQKEILLIDEVYEIGENLNIGINEIKTALKFFHDVGEVIHFQEDQELGKMVILDVQWLANLFKVIITQSMAYKDSLSTSPKLVQLVHKLHDQGLLDEELLDSLLTSKNRLQDKNILLSVMEKFDVTCQVPQQPGSSKCSVYFLPCLLQNDDESKCHDPENSELSDPLYFHFPGDFIPDGLFHRLIVRCWRKWYVEKVALTKWRARIFIPESNDFYCKVSKVGCDIEVQVLRIPSSIKYIQVPDWARWRSHARKFLKDELDSLIFMYTPGLRYHVSLKCRCGSIATGTIDRADEDNCVNVTELLEKQDMKARPLLCCHALKIDTTRLNDWYPECK
ncbi:uncharacterized protein [Ptychodera flava]|uniref:uncharacterized protein n=1 Tax=Ptychodera flava TaxID=63121 RepID=UPI003969EA56